MNSYGHNVLFYNYKILRIFSNLKAVALQRLSQNSSKNINLA